MNYRYIWKEIRHHRNRTLVNVLGIAVGIALFVSINAVSAAYQKAISLPFKNIGADIVVQRAEKRSLDSGQPPASMRGIRLPFSNQILSMQDMERLKTIPGVNAMATALLLWEFDQVGFLSHKLDDAPGHFDIAPFVVGPHVIGLARSTP